MSTNFPILKNDLMLKALKGEDVPRPPVWMMRQAGRYLPEYMELRGKYTFFERVETPDLACEITMQPIRRFSPDAAIIFSDILVVLQAIGIEVTLNPGEGPRIPNPVSTPEQAFALRVPDVHDRLHYVMEALTLTRHALQGEAALIGFAGAPWTLFCYLIEGKGSKDFSRAKAFYWQHPEASKHILSVITQTTIAYLKAQIAAGAQIVQVFDSWSGLLSPEDFNEIAFPYLIEICNAITEAPVILYPKGSWYALEAISYRTKAAALGVDWCITPEYARVATRNDITLQGNFDPSKLLASPDVITKSVHRMIDRFGSKKYIANLGHGILPFVPVDHARAFFDAVKFWEPSENK
ncbi:MAG: uroporphyrinogen decarboxylase [Balneolales bacterium]|nr:uroporphyrinogen decarboxylase [Balneolales bacterium]